MKQSKKKQTKNRSHHKVTAESTTPFKENNRSVVSIQGKKSKSQNKSNIKSKTFGAKTLSKSMSKIKMKINKNTLHSENSEEDESTIEEYFMFQNRIFPIINSDEKRTINRFFWTTDLSNKQNKSIKDTSTISTAFINKNETKQVAVMTQVQGKVTKDYNMQINIKPETKQEETMTLPVVVPKTVQSFEQILNQLQFLYLPDSKNFEGLNKEQKEHYRDLFMTFANKFSLQKRVLAQLESTLDELKIENQLSPRTLSQFVSFSIQKRISHQVNCVDVEIQKGIPTNLLCILSYLSNLFCFIEVQYRQQLLRGLNTPFGYYNQQRFSLLLKGKSLKRVQKILPDTIYSELEQEFFAEDDELDQETIECMHIHNKAIFDHLNDELNFFRPFYSCNGEPYPWFIPGKITFFSIGQEDIELVLQKAKVKILQSASLLCGLHCDAQPPFNKSTIDESNILKDVREERQRKLIFSQIMNLDESIQIQDERTNIVFKMAEDIYNEIIDQANNQICQLARGDSFYIPVFDITDD